MAKRDAFGREAGEDTLAGLGWTTSTAPASATPRREPAPASPAAAPPRPPAAPLPPASPAPARPTFARRRRRRPRVGRFLFLLVGVGLLWSFGVVEHGRDAVDDVRRSIRQAAPPPAGESLLNAAALRTALAELPAGRIVSLRVAPERLDAQVLAGRTLHVVQVRSGGGATDVKTPRPSGARPTLRVDPAAPGRLARTAARRAGRPLADVAYVLLMRLVGRTAWLLYFPDGDAHYEADAAGRHVKRVG